MPFGSEFHLPRLGQSLHLPSGIGMAFSGAPFGSEFHLSHLGQSHLVANFICLVWGSRYIYRVESEWRFHPKHEGLGLHTEDSESQEQPNE